MRKVFLIILLIVYSILYAAIKVYGKHRLRTSRDTTCTKCVTKSIVLNLVTQTAARTERVGIITKVSKEAMTSSIHLCCKVAPLFILAIAILCKHCHSLNRESKNSLCTLLIKPLHKTFLQPVHTFPIRLRTIREEEVTEKALEIILIII